MWEERGQSYRKLRCPELIRNCESSWKCSSDISEIIFGQWERLRYFKTFFTQFRLFFFFPPLLGMGTCNSWSRSSPFLMSGAMASLNVFLCTGSELRLYTRQKSLPSSSLQSNGGGHRCINELLKKWEKHCNRVWIRFSGGRYRKPGGKCVGGPLMGKPLPQAWEGRIQMCGSLSWVFVSWPCSWFALQPHCFKSLLPLAYHPGPLV